MKIERVEYYAGYQGEEKPRAVYTEGKRIEVVEIIWQARIQDNLSGRIKEVFDCQLASGEKIRIERELE